MADPLNPLALKISSVKIHKFHDDSSEIIILPQFVELNIYQSMFEPVIKGEMLINDNIGLFVNYPFTGEEVVTVTYEQATGTSGSSSISKSLYFIIRGVRDVVVSDKARSLMYVLELSSVEFLQNVRKYVAHAYNDTVEQMAKNVYDEYIAQDTVKNFGISKPFNVQKSTKVRHLVVPNLRPFQGIQWLAKHAVADDTDKYFMYLFFENMDGFHFTTMQKLIQDAVEKSRDSNRDRMGDSQNLMKLFTYISNKETADKYMSGDPQAVTKLISNIIFNKRLSSVERIVGGYYQNELFEISMLQKGYNSTPSELDPDVRPEYTLGQFPINTPNFINFVKNDKNLVEYSNRIRYIINNYEDFEGQGRSQPQYRAKFGNAARYLMALNQVDLTITVPANMDLKAGQVILVNIPEMHGFNIVNSDEYLSGMFIVSEVKQVIATGGRAATSMRIYKDGYTKKIEEQMKYKLGGSTADFQQ